jgi:dTDP-4-amino-4,6-dideoxygalactose transaminase
MVDLNRQHNKIRKEIDKAFAEVIDSSAFIKGPWVKRFEESLAKYLGCKHVIGCANGTDALQLALMALDLKPEDEIITPAFTFLATAEVVALMGLNLKLVDVDEQTFNISPEALAKAITPKTKAIIPVHLFGQAANMQAIMSIAKKHNLYIIEDTAQSLGADYEIDGKLQKLGTIGNIGCTSFFPTKNLGGMGDGGALYTNDDHLASRIRAIGNHGMHQRYWHELIGINSRLDSLQAAVLEVKLPHLAQSLEQRKDVANQYISKLKNIKGIELPATEPNAIHTYNQFTIKLINPAWRDALKAHLAEKGIPSMIYYPIAVHQQPAYLSLGYKEGDFPVSEALCKKVLSLPMHPELEEEQIAYICETIDTFVQSL